MSTTLFRQGLVFDGLGRPGVRADVLVRDERIERIAPSISEPTDAVVDVHDRWLIPGFIDIHTHYDVEVEISPGLPESVRHGVTSVVMGNCSLSIMMGAPSDVADIFLRVENLSPALVRRWLDHAVKWDNPAAYFTHLNQLALGPRVAALLGHSALRCAAMGLERSLGATATDEDLRRMRELAEEALDAGAIGISIDMVHWHKVTGVFAGHSVPSHYASLSEYKMLADLCRTRDLVFQVVPDPTRPYTLFRALFWSVGIFRAPLRLTVLSALDLTKPRWFWRVFPVLTFVFNRLLGANVRFQTLTEAFTIYADGPITPLFEEFASGVELNSLATSAERKALWTTPGFRKRFHRDWYALEIRSFHRRLDLVTVTAHPRVEFIGRTIAALATERGQAPLDTFMDFLAEYDTEFRWVSTGANDRPRVREKLMASPFILPGFTDAGAHSRNLAFFDGPISLLKQAVQTGFMTFERALQRVTSEPSQWFGVEGGVLRPGARADFLVIDPEGLRSPITEPIESSDPLLDGALRMVKPPAKDLIAAVYIYGREVARDAEPLSNLGREQTGSVLKPIWATSNSRQALARYRNRLDDTQLIHPLKNYWDIFVYKHQNWGNVLAHCLAVLMVWSATLALILTWDPRWLLLGLASQLVGLFGHWYFEPNHVDVRDFVFSMRASRSLNRMLISVLTGRYSAEIARVRREFSA